MGLSFIAEAATAAKCHLDPSTNRWFAERYNVNNARNFNGNNGNLNNNNVTNVIRVQAVATLAVQTPERANSECMEDAEFFGLMFRTMRRTRKNKRYGRDSVEFEADWPSRLVRMTEALRNRTFRIDRNAAFLVSVPKWREIFATSADGRIADHLLCDTLEPFTEAELHDRTFNNRKGMGCQAAMNQVIEDIAEVSNGYTETAWIIKWDLKGFFPNAKCDEMEMYFHQVVDKHHAEIVADTGEDKAPSFLKWLATIAIHCCPARHCELRTPRYMWAEHIEPEKSLMGKPPGIGTPIGRQTSQTGMGLYINDEVRWLNDECGIRTTVFMDDGVEVVPDRLKAYALSLMPELRRRLAAKGVMMNTKKFYCQQHWKGLEFLGSHIKPRTIILNDNTWSRCLERISTFNQLPKDKKYEYIDKFRDTVNSYTGLLKNRTSYRRICSLCKHIHPDWWVWFDWDSDRLCLIGKPQHALRARLRRKYHIKLKNKTKQHTHERIRKTAAHQ